MLGEGHRDVPWIWYAVRYTAQDRVDTGAATDEDAIECKCFPGLNTPRDAHMLTKRSFSNALHLRPSASAVSALGGGGTFPKRGDAESP